MTSLLKIMLTVALVFATTFVIARITGVLSVETVEDLLLTASTVSPWTVAAITTALLFADLFIAVPTLTIIILTGYFLGPIAGFGASILGMMLAGVTGYILSNKYGESILVRVMKDAKQRQDAKEAFQKHGFATIMLSRAMPILPEVSACMAGLTGMAFFKFSLAWIVGTVPYVMIAVYAGSISSLENPKPAIFTAIGLTAVLWTSWLIFNKRRARVE